MAFGFRDFENDPFFREVEPPRHMMMDPFATSSRRQQQVSGQHPPRDPFQSMMMPFGGGMMMDPFQRMNSMLANFENMSRSMGGDMGGAMGRGHSHSYSSSSVMHYSSSHGNGSGQPQVYQASSSTVMGPGGVKETRQSVKDSHSGLEKMAITQQIGDRSHKIEKKYNHKKNEREENQEFVNLDETEAAGFSREWEKKTQHLNHHALGGGPSHRGRQREAEVRGLPSGLPEVPQHPPAHHHHSRVHDPDSTQNKGMTPSSRRSPYSTPRVDGVGVATERQRKKKSKAVHF